MKPLGQLNPTAPRPSPLFPDLPAGQRSRRGAGMPRPLAYVSTSCMWNGARLHMWQLLS